MQDEATRIIHKKLILDKNSFYRAKNLIFLFFIQSYSSKYKQIFPQNGCHMGEQDTPNSKSSKGLKTRHLQRITFFPHNDAYKLSIFLRSKEEMVFSFPFRIFSKILAASKIVIFQLIQTVFNQLGNVIGLGSACLFCQKVKSFFSSLPIKTNPGYDCAKDVLYPFASHGQQ
ncbi:hypothetical protein JGUZn3_15290 [Entomobacter blattae]|uniref:Uncharacterized protein n=1 Tax=Entomobacter blattae TaxID=2762277 RepID=A0A7H1NSJ2_9PROT|nr:hypothetical protein JGUZn3_15290 [Entomobacter blattae]